MIPMIKAAALESVAPPPRWPWSTPLPRPPPSWPAEPRGVERVDSGERRCAGDGV